MVSGPAQGAPCGGNQAATTKTPGAPRQCREEGFGELGCGGSVAHTGAWAVGGSPSPLCCSTGHPLAPGPQRGPSSSGPLPGVGAGGPARHLC